VIGAFLDELEKDRGNAARSRNLRLTAIRSFYRYAAYEDPTQSGLIQRILAMPAKRYEKKLIGFLTRPEIEAVLAAPISVPGPVAGITLFWLVAVQTGLRLSEMTSLHTPDVVLGTGRHVRCMGKGRKERCTPLAKQAIDSLQTMAAGTAGRGAGDILSKCKGTRAQRRRSAVSVGQTRRRRATEMPFLKNKRVTPHVLRHSAAMEPSASRRRPFRDCTLARTRSIETTQIYLDADLGLRKKGAC